MDDKPISQDVLKFPIVLLEVHKGPIGVTALDAMPLCSRDPHIHMLKSLDVFNSLIM